MVIQLTHLNYKPVNCKIQIIATTTKLIHLPLIEFLTFMEEAGKSYGNNQTKVKYLI